MSARPCMGAETPDQAMQPAAGRVSILKFWMTSPRQLRLSLKVLLLEGRDDFREVLHEHLVSRSYQVTSVPSGAEGLREIMKGAFDLIIYDMITPQMGGEMFYWAVTRARPGAARRFIFFTGDKSNPAMKFFFKRVNATALIKPSHVDLSHSRSEVIEALDSAIGDVVRKLY